MTDQPARYRRRPAEIEAVQWTGSNADAMRALCSPFDFQEIEPEDRAEDPDETAAVRTHPHGGWVGLKPGDWAVKNGKVFSVLRGDEFADLYEPAAVQPPADRAALVERAAQAIRDSNGTLEALAWWQQHPQLIPAHVYAAAVLAVLPEPADRAAVLREAADRFQRRGRVVLAATQAADALRRLADETPAATPEPDFIPPAAAGLPAGTLEAAEIGANRLDGWARTPQGRNFLAHALVQLARTGWLRTEPGEGFEAQPDSGGAEARQDGAQS
jgi:hypothetical protein